MFKFIRTLTLVAAVLAMVAIDTRILQSAALASSLVGSLALSHPAAGAASPSLNQPGQAQAFTCMQTVQPYTVPGGVTSLSAVVAGAHGSYPSNGADGGRGGYVSGSIAVTPGQTLYVWVGCLAKHGIAWGYGNGGKKGHSPNHNDGDAGWGGGGSAVTLDAAGYEPLLIAGGGGGGGGNDDGWVLGGMGGDGGNPPGNGESGERNPHSGGMGGAITGRGNGGANGEDGVNGGAASGGGGGGWGGGAAGKPVKNDVGGGGGGGGGGSSYADPSVTGVVFATSTFSKDGSVYIITIEGSVVDADVDRVPDALDRCPASDRRPTVVIDGRDTGARNHQDADGCTLSDRINTIAAGATTHRQFVRDVAELTLYYHPDNLLRRAERRAIIEAAWQSDIPARPPARGRTAPEEHASEAAPDE